MSTELSNGVIIPEEYSDDWYDEMSINLRKLNDVITAASDNATDIQRLDTDKANQSDLTALTSRVTQNETDITALQTAVSGALKREIVQTLPTQDISTTTIYMIRNTTTSGDNIYDEYMYINSQWELIGTSATDFSNYYTKTESDNLLSGKVDNSTLGSYYTKTESDNLLSAKANQSDLTALSGRVTQTETDITALQTAVSGALKREIVQSLPTQDISTTTIYMIRNTTTSGDNIYDEYMYINSQWELIGTSATDFSNYYTKTEIDTLLSYKASDSDVVHKSGNETISGTKSFPDGIVANVTGSATSATYDGSGNVINSTYGKLGAANEWTSVNIFKQNVTYERTNFYHQVANPSYILKDTELEKGSLATTHASYPGLWLDKNGNILGYVRFVEYSSGRQTAEFKVSNLIKNGALDPTGSEVNCAVNLELQPSGEKSLIPEQNNDINLGTATKKWKSFNGLTPSSLSLPSTTGVVDISSYITDLTGTANTYTVLANGYIQFDVTGSSVEIDVTNGLSQKWIMTDPKGFIPVVSGASVSIKVVGTAINNFKFIPCQANI